MTAPRRPAGIGRELRSYGGGWVPQAAVDGLADELDALDATHVCVPKECWPTADQIAVLRTDVVFLRAGGSWQFHSVGDRLAAFLDKLDPPQPEPQADDDVVTVERSAVEGVLGYLSTENDSEPWYVALRAALDARRQ